MGFIAEYTLSNPILQKTREAVPEVAFTVEDEQPAPDEHSRLILWARGSEDELDRFLGELPDDPTISDFDVLSTIPERRLFSITLSPAGERGLTYVAAIEFGITFLDIEAEGTDVEYRAQVPSREALLDYRELCRERDLSFELHRLYRSEGDATAEYGITARQQEVLRRALKRGYYEVPREISSEELADEFEISSQALSALLRRGHAALLGSTIAEDGRT